MKRRIPLFPLPGVVLLPGTLLPLHIFEPRYRALVSDCLEGDRVIGMAMMKPGRETAGANPEILSVGGAGEVVEVDRLEDGRYNILLEGRFRYRILEEAREGSYRTARVEEIDSVPFPDGRSEARIQRLATTLFEGVAGVLELPPLPDEDLSPERRASEIALRLRYTPPELQSLLETDSLPARFDALLRRMREWRRRIRFLAPFRPSEIDPRKN